VVYELLIGTKIADLEWRNGPYSALFHRIRVRHVVIKSSRSLSHLLMGFLSVAFLCCIFHYRQYCAQRMRRYLSYSEADFEVFHPAGATI